MVFTKALVLKVLGGLAVCTGVTVGGVKLFEGSRTQTEGQGDSDSKDKNNTQGDSQRTAGDNNSPNPQPTENPAGDGVNSNPGNPQAQTLQNPSEGAENSPAQTSSQPQQNSQKPGSEEGTDPGSSTGDRVEPQPQQKPSVTEPGNKSNLPAAVQSITNSGLKCNSDTNKKQGECSGIAEGKTINVKWDNGTKREGINSLTIPAGTKIKYEWNTADSNYHKLLKITIVGGDITLNGGTPETITKLEEFETYEIKEEGSGQDKKYYLNRKYKSFKEKSIILGLPDNCVIPENGSEVSCPLTADELKKIKFEGKGSNQTTFLESDNTKQSTLTIVKTPDSDFSPEGYKFTLKTEYTISFGSGSQNNKIISNTNTEFKIKVTTPANGDKTLTLEKAWNLNTLAAKVGLTGCTTADSANECNLPATINVSNGEGDNTEGASISGTSPKIKFLQDQPKHNQGFKFYPQADITLSGGNPSVNDKKIESKGSYEIKKIGDKWYLSKVTESK